METHIHAKAKLSAAVAAYITPIAREAIALSGRCTIALSGGSMPKLLGAADGLATINTDWSKW